MSQKSPYNIRYLRMLARQYPTVQAASNKIINMNAILNLPKPTEHFMSDIHGEYEAFLHILNNASGAIREKVDILYGNSMSQKTRAGLATLIYYPEEKLAEIKEEEPDLDEWYRLTLHSLTEIAKFVTSKYTRSKVRSCLPDDYADIIEELLHTFDDAKDKKDYYENIIATIIQTDRADEFIIAISDLIKNMIVDHLHIVGDIFDRGPRADIIMDSLIAHRSVDIQWGNHDVLWMGAATGSRSCIAAVLNNSITYNNLDVIETGYGISLRPLAVFANEVYESCDLSCFKTKIASKNIASVDAKDMELGARMHKAIAVILFKLEGAMIQRHPEFGMNDRLLLDKIDYKKKTVQIDGVTYNLKDTDFPTINPEDPYTLSPDEAKLMQNLKNAFRKSEKLQKHVRFLYSKGGLYKCFNGNLMFHGCIPMNEDGSLMEFSTGCMNLSGKDFLDYADRVARQGYYSKPGSSDKQYGIDFLWYLWCGRNSPLFGRDKITTFERLLIDDKSAWTEKKNAYYTYYEDEKVCNNILAAFGLNGPHCHIINGHVPVKSKDGETPIKANGKLIVIDGGFCYAYQPTTGIAGYTLIYNSQGMRIASHEPFVGRNDAITNNKDIVSTSVIFDRMESRIKIAETDTGKELIQQIEDLKELLEAYKRGDIKEDHPAANNE